MDKGHVERVRDLLNGFKMASRESCTGDWVPVYYSPYIESLEAVLSFVSGIEPEIKGLLERISELAAFNDSLLLEVRALQSALSTVNRQNREERSNG